jgi:hypothetical protein
MGKFPRFRKKDIDTWLDGQKIPAVNPAILPFKR